MIDPSTISLAALAACRLFPWDKVPGVRPISIYKVSRRIIGKAILSIVNPEIQQATGSTQLCAGQPCGFEAAIHTMRSIYGDPDTDGILLDRRAECFNALSRQQLCEISNGSARKSRPSGLIYTVSRQSFLLSAAYSIKWGNQPGRTLFDVRVLPPKRSLYTEYYVACEPALETRMQQETPVYEQRVREVEGASFVPLVFSTAGAMGPTCATTLKCLASMLSGKLN